MDEYDVSKYSDAELLQILDIIGQPTDRELEMQILNYIQRAQENANTDEGTRLEQFFIGVYNHFFMEDAEHDEETHEIEGFTTPTPPTSHTAIMNMGEAVESENSNFNEIIPTQEAVTGGRTGDTQIINYVAGRLNPILKQTIKRIISIDSQFRENKQLASTNFTFNLSEPLKDVLSLKLYSIQIPTTWYNVNTNYGSNFIYLKGDTDGINNGNHDYKIEIMSGNYPQSDTGTNKDTDIIRAINSSISTLKTTYLDVSFGETKVSFNSTNAKISIKIDIKKTYNQTNYYLEFPALSSTQIQPERKKTLASYLGFNNLKYDCFCFYSERNLLLLNDSDDNLSIYRVDNSNNKIKIVAYTGLGDTVADMYATQLLNIEIELPINSYTRNSLVNEINYQLHRNEYLDASYSYVERINIDSSLENGDKSYFKFSVKINRTKINYSENIKTAVILPEIDISQPPIWIGTTSCFHFINIINNTNIIQAETPTLQTNYSIDRLNQIQFHCTVNKYNSGNNDYIATIPYNVRPGYILQDYIQSVNNAIIIANQTSISLNMDDLNLLTNKTGMYFSNNRIYLDVDINRTFTNKHYKISIDMQNLGFNMTNLPLETESVSNNITIIQASEILYYSVTIKSTDKIIITPYGTSGNELADPFIIYMGEYKNGGYQDKTINSISELINYITEKIATYQDPELINPLNGSFATISLNPAELKMTLSLSITVNKYLTQRDYSIIFYDVGNRIDNANNWNNYLKFDLSYNLKIDSSPKIVSSNGMTTIQNNEIVDNQLIQLFDNSNNYFYLKSYVIDGLIGASNFEMVKIKMNIVSGNFYSVDDVYNLINEQLNLNPITIGSKIENVNKNNNYYTKFNFLINSTYTTKDFRLVFYDPYSYIQCYAGATKYKNKSVKNVTQDSTLGWLLGYRAYIVYYLKDYVGNVYTSDTNPGDLNSYSGNMCILIADTGLSLYLYNNFMLMLNDYTQSHINDGIVSITAPESNITVPSTAKISCDPMTNEPYVASQPGMTMKQLYSYNERLKARYLKSSSYIGAPYSQDILAIIQINNAGLSNGSNYIVSSGQLQNQERMYFGPVNIFRMTIQLLNDRGEIMDLNNNDWSFCLICEQLYSNESSS